MSVEHLRRVAKGFGLIFTGKSIEESLKPYQKRVRWTRYKQQLYQLIKEPSITIFLNLRLLCWVRHVPRMENSRPPQRPLYNHKGESLIFTP